MMFACCTTMSIQQNPDPACMPSFYQVGSFGDPGRDPRGWTVTVAYGAIVPDTNLGVKAAVSATATIPIGGRADVEVHEVTDWHNCRHMPVVTEQFALIREA